MNITGVSFYLDIMRISFSWFPRFLLMFLSHMWLAIQLEWLVACYTAAQSDRAPPTEDVFLISRRSQLSAAEIRSQSASPLTSHSSSWSTWRCRSALWALARPLFCNCSHCFCCSISHITASTYSFLSLLQFFWHSCKRWPVLGVF